MNGCTDATAGNYDASANTDDGSCIAVVYGCTDATAGNYDASANTDDGSCVAVVNGCTDTSAFNYDATANVDDGSCTPFAYGCTDSTAANYNASANSGTYALYCCYNFDHGIGDTYGGGVIFKINVAYNHAYIFYPTDAPTQMNFSDTAAYLNGLNSGTAGNLGWRLPEPTNELAWMINMMPFPSFNSTGGSSSWYMGVLNVVPAGTQIPYWRNFDTLAGDDSLTRVGNVRAIRTQSFPCYQPAL